MLFASEAPNPTLCLLSDTVSDLRAVEELRHWIVSDHPGEAEAFIDPGVDEADVNSHQDRVGRLELVG